jgi:hypothetical protein
VRGKPFNFTFAKLFASKTRPRESSSGRRFSISASGVRRRTSSVASLDERTKDRFRR